MTGNMNHRPATMTYERYRSMALRHLSALSIKRCVAIRDLPDEELRMVGASVITKTYDIRSVVIDMPGPGALERAVSYMEETMRENGIQPELATPKKERRSRRGKRRRHEEEGFDDAEPMDEGLRSATGSSVGLKETF